MPKPLLARSNNDDRRQWRKQGVAVGAAASKMRAAAKQTLGAATRAVSPKVTERARMLTIKYKRSDNIPPTKSPPIATRCPFRNGLALSGAYAPALPEGEPFGNGSQSNKFIKHKKKKNREDSSGMTILSVFCFFTLIRRSALRWRRTCRPHRRTLCRCPPGRAARPAHSEG